MSIASENDSNIMPINDDDDNEERNEELRHELHLGREKLQLIASVSALIAGFSVVALVELNLRDELPAPLIMVYTILSCVLVALHLFGTMIAVCILPTLALMDRLTESRHEASLLKHYSGFRVYIQYAWYASMGFGIFLFLLELVVIVWMQMYNISNDAAIAGSALAFPVLIGFIWIGVSLGRHESAFMMDAMSRRQADVVQQFQETTRILTSTKLSSSDDA